MATLLSACYVSDTVVNDFHGLNHLPYFIKSKLLLMVGIIIVLCTAKEKNAINYVMTHH